VNIKKRNIFSFGANKERETDPTITFIGSILSVFYLQFKSALLESAFETH